MCLTTLTQVAGDAVCDVETKAGYTPLHVAAHFGQVSYMSVVGYRLSWLSYLTNNQLKGSVQYIPILEDG